MSYSFFTFTLLYKHKITAQFNRIVKLQPIVSSCHSKFVRQKYIKNLNLLIYVFVIGRNICITDIKI